ncbi:FMN-linked oxidoreductase [Punctularia strigosozonata HHB-11173 SS5]|uniref:FMN-linked oxidoreductase n=1 Tax=Punctularia strigosozonata (strain HHB-11173) TaxID=741275 RepID=R7S2V4_PUNST|nr:FMN-linked oxidoreductase [Punctularia strigosozonata HHB-11173 SS5]EIN03581.1 FMN-linked oxidoreductase [Punctularia strigosozonata HHB-11173 SS5]
MPVDAKETPKLFQPVSVGALTLRHRIVLAPLTRCRSTSERVPLDIVAEMYEQRSRTAGTLLISEGTVVAAQAVGFPHTPGVWSAEQISGWKKVTSAVHKNGSFIFCQLFAHGRGGDPSVVDAEGPFDYVAPSAIKLTECERTPRELTLAEVEEYVHLFVQAAKNAIEAGFDGVEIHGANGYLIDQFTQSNSNQRTDVYGGSIENRSRFALEIVDGVSKAIGAEKVGFRVSPWSPFQDMRMPDPIPQFSHLVSALRSAHPNLAYLHVVEPRISGSNDKDPSTYDPTEESNDFLRKIWKGKPIISAGGYTRESALEHSEKTGELVAFGRHFIANPDLVERFTRNIPLNKYDRSTFYAVMSPVGYVDQPFASYD